MGFDVKITTKISVLDLVFPFSCRGCGRMGGLLCECCKNYNIKTALRICARCKQDQKACRCTVPVYAVAWREGVMRDLVEDYKYKSIRASAKVLAEILDAVIPQEIGETEELVIVPLPTINRHIRERGFDHTLLLAKKLAKRRKKARVEKILRRKNKTVQVGANEATRKKQAKDAYETSSGIKIDPEKTYLLLDDVWTTGASMGAAIAEMQKAGAKKVRAAVMLTSR